MHLKTGDGRGGLLLGSERCCYLGVFWQRHIALEPAMLLSQRAQGGELASPHIARACQLTVRVAVAHAYEDMSILVHLDSPSAHCCLPEAYFPSSLAGNVHHKSRCPFRSPAPICRKPAGSFMPETQWLLYAENSPAPLCRKSIGSYTPKDDNHPVDPEAPERARRRTRASQPDSGRRSADFPGRLGVLHEAHVGAHITSNHKGPVVRGFATAVVTQL